ASQALEFAPVTHAAGEGSSSRIPQEGDEEAVRSCVVVCLSPALILAGGPASRAPEPPADDAAALALRAATELRLGHYADAETAWRRVIALRQAERAPTPELAAALEGLGEVLRRRGRFDDAEAVLARALALEERTFGPESRSTVPSLTALGTMARSRGRYEEAEWLYRR